MVRSFSDSNFVVVFIYFCFCSFYWLNAFVVLGIMKQGFDAFYFVFFCFLCFLWQKINWQEYSLDFFLSDISSCIRESSQVILVSTISIKSSFFFFSIRFFFRDHSRITGLQGKGEGISLTPHYHFHPLHGHLDISGAITAENSPLHIAGSRPWTKNLWFLSASS